jgi:hypothetical protein
MAVDPHSDLLRKPPLPRSTGERKRLAATPALFLYPTLWGRGGREADGVGEPPMR